MGLKYILTGTFIVAIFMSYSLLAQEVTTLEAEIGIPYNFGEEVRKEIEMNDALLKDLSSGKKQWNNLTDEENVILHKYGEVFESMWNPLNAGCSWYCGAGNYKVKTSSSLTSQGENSYDALKIYDFSYQTAWVEGVKGHGIGETIEYIFPAYHPRITKIIIANGYIKSEKSWKDNSSVKKLKLYVNDQLFAFLNLEDVYAEQSFSVSEIGCNSDMRKTKECEGWVLRFEIAEVYKGSKYEDTAISEIYFDGIDVH